MKPHAPTPWRVSNESDRIILDATGLQVASADYLSGDIEYRWAETVANAEFIVAACNAHDDLLSALELMVSVGCEFCDMDMGANGREAVEVARAAIAKARGGK